MLAFPIGVGPPIVLRIPVFSAAGDLDLTTVTSLVPISVLRPDGSSTTWNGAVAPGVTVTSGFITYAFQTTDLLIKGLWYATPLMTVPGGIDPTWPSIQFRVVDIWGMR